MILIMIVGLYTVRIVLETLGIEDFGIYNVVGGIVTIVGFVSGTMASASQRFFAFELGRKDITRFQQIFSLNFTIYLSISILVLIFAETIGLWFLNKHLNIPDHRLNSANWVYHFSVLSFIFTILSIPYNAAIIAYEKMSFFAYVSIVDVMLKLLVVFLLRLFPYDKLTLYAILICTVTFITTIVYWIYCSRKIPGCKITFYWDKSMFKILMSYSGWNLLGGGVTGILNSQGLNILLNLFFGPIINAAKAISDKVNSAIISFSTNFYMAVNPQIIKNYAEGDSSHMINLALISSRFSYYLLLILSLPVILETKYILFLWLGEVNNDIILFTRITLIFSLINILENPISQMIRATGEIKKYQLTISSITILLLPMSYIAFLLGFPAEASLYILVILYIISHFFRLIILKKQLKVSPYKYTKEVLYFIIIVSILATIIPLLIATKLNYGLSRFFMTTITSLISTVSAIYLTGITTTEREKIKNAIYNYIKIKS